MNRYDQLYKEYVEELEGFIGQGMTRTQVERDASILAHEAAALEPCRHGLVPFDCEICSHEGWGTWSTMCRHGRHVEDCVECNPD